METPSGGLESHEAAFIRMLIERIETLEKRKDQQSMLHVLPENGYTIFSDGIPLSLQFPIAYTPVCEFLKDLDDGHQQAIMFKTGQSIHIPPNHLPKPYQSWRQTAVIGHVGTPVTVLQFVTQLNDWLHDTEKTRLALLKRGLMKLT